MKIGITFDLKTSAKAGAPDDADEEFDSPHTIEAIANVLRGRGHEVVLLGDGCEFVEKVLALRPDFVFNFAEGHGISRSREARVPAVLELLGIPYTGSDPFTPIVQSALKTMNKCRSSYPPIRSISSAFQTMSGLRKWSAPAVAAKPCF